MARELVTQAQNLVAHGVGGALEAIGTVVARSECLVATFGDAREAASALVDRTVALEPFEPVPYWVVPASAPAAPAIHASPAVGVSTLGFADGGVLIRGETGDVLGIDAIGTRIWPLLDGERPLDDVADELAASFRAPAPQVRADVETWVDELVGLGFLRRAD